MALYHNLFLFWEFLSIRSQCFVLPDLIIGDNILIRFQSPSIIKRYGVRQTLAKTPNIRICEKFIRSHRRAYDNLHNTLLRVLCIYNI